MNRPIGINHESHICLLLVFGYMDSSCGNLEVAYTKRTHWLLNQGYVGGLDYGSKIGFHLSNPIDETCGTYTTLLV